MTGLSEKPFLVMFIKDCWKMTEAPWKAAKKLDCSSVSIFWLQMQCSYETTECTTFGSKTFKTQVCLNLQCFWWSTVFQCVFSVEYIIGVVGAHGGILVQPPPPDGDLGGPVLGGESDLACRLYGPLSGAPARNLCNYQNIWKHTFAFRKESKLHWHGQPSQQPTI